MLVLSIKGHSGQRALAAHLRPKTSPQNLAEFKTTHRKSHASPWKALQTVTTDHKTPWKASLVATSAHPSSEK